MARFFLLILIWTQASYAGNLSFEGTWKVQNQSCTVNHEAELCYMPRSVVTINQAAVGKTIFFDSANSSGKQVEHLTLKSLNEGSAADFIKTYLSIYDSNSHFSWFYQKQNSNLNIIQTIAVRKTEDRHYTVNITKTITFKSNNKTYFISEILDLVQ